ncbi:MAG: PhoH family protein [Deltaproteobacteria bacterium]|nr:PhoH family protein [Deltaproteobacteria bacterium]
MQNTRRKDGRKNSPKSLTFEDMDAFMSLCGRHDENLKRLGSRLGVEVRVRGNRVSLSGADGPTDLAGSILGQLYELACKGTSIGIEEVDRGIAVLSNDPSASLPDVMNHFVRLPVTDAPVAARSPNQQKYLAAMTGNEVIIAIGPAGTGKTFLAMATAVSQLLNKTVKRIVLTRPAVEAGERLGFLPGDLQEKVNPYLRPLYDALYHIMDVERGNRLMANGQIEIAPLAFMRGRTLDDSFVILDEAQNCSIDQMKMFLTRLGYNSRAVVTGDVTQTDLPAGRQSGLEHAHRILNRVPGIVFCEFDEQDVMRHPVVRRIIRAYADERRDRRSEEVKH